MKFWLITVNYGDPTPTVNLINSIKNCIVKPKIKRVAIPNEFSDKYGSQENLLASWGLDASSLVQVVKENLVD